MFDENFFCEKCLGLLISQRPISLDNVEPHRKKERAYASLAKIILEKEKFFTPSDLAKRHQKSRQFFARLLQSGEIRAKKTAASWVTTSTWVKEWEERQQMEKKIREFIRGERSRPTDANHY